MDWTKRFTVKEVDFSHPAMQVSMPLVSYHDGELRCNGTAFAVAPGLAITAEHVVNHCISYQQRRDGYKRSDSSLLVMAFQCFNSNFYVWQVDEIYTSPIADIAFLRFIRPDWWGDGPGQVKPRCARLNFNPPSVGEELRLFGFPNSEVLDKKLYTSPSECLVQVISVDLKTDKRSRPRSHFDVIGEIHHGMSGGPCFDKDWNVIGVNSSGWELLEGPPLARVALLWPALNSQIDPFESGAFPAIDLFKQGATTAIGYRRVHVTSKGEVRFANVDPNDLIPIHFPMDAQYVKGALEFSASNAKNALGEVQVLSERALEDGQLREINELHRSLRHYFWELESVLRLASQLAAVQAGITVDASLDWDQLVDQLRERIADPLKLDELSSTLEFSWHGVDLFEVRTYAELCRRGSYRVISETSGDGRLRAMWITQCRRGSNQIRLPDGLYRFYDSTQRFVQRLLGMSNRMEMTTLQVPAE